MHFERMRNRQKIPSDSNFFDYRVGMETCFLSSDYDLMMVLGRGVKGFAYLNDIIDFTRDKLNDLAYVSASGETKVLSGSGKYVIDGVRKKHNGVYANVYYDPVLSQSRCYYGNYNVLATCSLENVHCCLELVGDEAFLLQGECPDKIMLGDKEYVVHQNNFQYFDACDVDLSCEGYILRIAGQNYRCKFVPTYDVLVVSSEYGYMTTSDGRRICGNHPVDTILEIDFQGNIIRVRDDVYVYHTKNPIPSSTSMSVLVKHMQAGDVVSKVNSPCVCEGIQDENREAVNIVTSNSNDFDILGSYFSDVLSYVAKPGFLFYPTDVADILRKHNIYIKNGIIKGSMMASEIIPHVKYKEFKGSTIVDLICSMYSKNRSTDSIVEYFYKRHMNVSDSVLDNAAVVFLQGYSEKNKAHFVNLLNVGLIPYKTGYYVTANNKRFFVDPDCYIDLNLRKRKHGLFWTRRLLDVFGEMNLEYESYLLHKLSGIPKCTEIHYPCVLPKGFDCLHGTFCVKLLYNNFTIYANLNTGECVVGDKQYSAIFYAFASLQIDT